MGKYFITYDIETIPLNFDELEESQQEYLIRNANTPEEIEKRKNEMALSPFTGKIIAIGLKIVEKTADEHRNVVYKAISSGVLVNKPTQDDNEEAFQEEIDGKIFYYCNERKLLETFWKVIEKYKNSIFVTFNGRNFDAPFIQLRSAILQVLPSRNLMEGTRYNYSKHIDLMDELTFYNPTFQGATRRFNLNFYTIAFGLKSPKSEGVDGANVKEYYQNGEYRTIAEYCLRDVEATWELYLKIKNYLFL